jgi:hypothetical protein
MPQTRDNGIVVPVNSDEYNLTADLSTMADSAKVVTVVSGSTARNALTKFEGRLAYRTDTTQIESVVGGAWRDGTRDYAPMSPTGWSAAGTITVTPEGTKRRVIADLVITRTGGAFVLDTASWNILGTDGVVVPSSAAGSSPVKYLSAPMVGGATNYSVHATYNPTGAVSIRAITSFTLTTGMFFTINVVYYI